GADPDGAGGRCADEPAHAPDGVGIGAGGWLVGAIAVGDAEPLLTVACPLLGPEPRVGDEALDPAVGAPERGGELGEVRGALALRGVDGAPTDLGDLDRDARAGDRVEVLAEAGDARVDTLGLPGEG